MLDVGAERPGDSQPVDGEQWDEGVLARRGKSGGDEECASLEPFTAAVPEVNAAPSPMTIHDVAVDGTFLAVG